jgi:hypothetical protein
MEALIGLVSQRFGILEKFAHEAMDLASHLVEVVSMHNPLPIPTFLQFVTKKHLESIPISGNGNAAKTAIP